MVKSDSTYIRYGHPPILEAILDVAFESPVNKKDLDAVRKKYVNFYSKSEQLTNVNVRINANDLGAKTDVDKENAGCRFSSDDMTDLLIIKDSNFTLSHLAPYQGWEAFLNRFKRDWKTWKRVVGYQKIKRIGVRFINRIDIPVTEERVEHENFLNIYPKLPDSFPSVHSYQVECILPIDSIDSQLRLTSSVVPSPVLNHMSFIIDQDIFKINNLPQKDADIIQLLNLIQIEKNRVFESCVTDQARELFK